MKVAVEQETARNPAQEATFGVRVGEPLEEPLCEPERVMKRVVLEHDRRPRADLRVTKDLLERRELRAAYLP